MHFSFILPRRRLLLWLLLSFTTLLILMLALASSIVVKGSNSLLYSNVDKLPSNRVGLLLGTSPRLSNGDPNYFFIYRIDAAAMLYFRGKIRYILVSGDNRHLSYNEPQEMRRALPSGSIISVPCILPATKELLPLPSMPKMWMPMMDLGPECGSTSHA